MNSVPSSPGAFVRARISSPLPFVRAALAAAGILWCGASHAQLAIQSGETRSGSIAGPSFLEAWTFDGSAGDRVLINAVWQSGGLDTHLRLYPPGGGPAEADSTACCYYGGDQLDLALQDTGTYTLVVSDFGLSNSGTYELTLVNLTAGPLDYAGDLDGGAISSGEMFSGSIDASSDIDAFQFYATAGDHVVLNLLTTSGPLDTHMRLYPPGGGDAEVDVTWCCYYGGDQLDHQLLETGIYTIFVEDFGLYNTGSYQATFVNLTAGPLSYAGDLDGGLIASGETFSGSIDVTSDIDAFQFYGTAGERVLLNLVTTSGPLDTHIRLYPPGGENAEVDVTWCCYFGGDQLDHQLLETGIYTIFVEDFGLYNVGTYQATFVNLTTGPLNYAGDFDGGPITSGETFSGSIDVTSDIDAFQFYGTAGERVLLNLVTTSGPLDTHIRLYPPGGGNAEVDVTWCCYFGGDQLDHQLLETGIYTIFVEDFGLYNAGTYQATFVNLTSGPSNYAGDLDGRAITSGETLPGSIDTASDIDAFQFYGTAGERMLLNLVTTSGLLDTHMRLYPPGGGPAEVDVTWCCYYGGDQLDHQLLETGLYTIFVEDFALSRAGDYLLTFLKMPDALFSPCDRDGGVITSGFSGSGMIDAATDADAYQFFGLAGERVIFDAVATGGALDTHIRLYPPGGGDAEADSTLCCYFGGDQIDHQLLASGLYTFVVADYALSSAGSYAVTLLKLPGAVPAAPSGPTPSNSALASPQRSVLSWDALPGATGYDVYLGTEALEPLVQIGTNLPVSAVAIPGTMTPFAAGAICRWQVIAHTPSGDVAGPVWEFFIAPDCGHPRVARRKL